MGEEGERLELKYKPQGRQGGKQQKSTHRAKNNNSGDLNRTQSAAVVASCSIRNVYESVKWHSTDVQAAMQQQGQDLSPEENDYDFSTCKVDV